MQPDTKRRVKRTAALAGLVASAAAAAPALLVDFLFLASSVNPMTAMFVGRFRVRNDSGEDVRIWPAGRRASGRFALLPLYATAFPAIPALRTGGFRLSAGAATHITYDWDDITFTTIVVQGREGALRAVPTDVDVLNGGGANQRELYVIPPLHGLRQADTEERAAVERSRSMYRLFGPALMLPIVPIFFYLLQRRFRPRPRALTAAAAAS